MEPKLAASVVDTGRAMAGVFKFPQLSVAKASHGTPIELKVTGPQGKSYQGSWHGYKAKEPLCTQRCGVYRQAYRGSGLRGMLALSARGTIP